MKRKLIAFSMLLALFTTSVTSAVASPIQPMAISNRGEEEIPIIVNDTEINCDQPPVIIEDRVLVPLRAIFESLDAEVYWNNDTRSVTAIRGDTTILLTIGSSLLYKNGEIIYMDVPGQIVNSRTMVPLRAVSESLGSSVYWDNETRTVHIYTDNYEEPEDPGTKPDNPEVNPPEEKPPVVDDQAAAYNAAMELYENGYSYQAYYAFKDLENYRDSAEMSEKAKLLNRISYNYNDGTSKWFVEHVNNFTPVSESEIASIMTQGSWICPGSQYIGYSVDTFLENGTRAHNGLTNMEWHIAFGGIYPMAYDPNNTNYTIYSLILQKDFRELTEGVYADIAVKVSTPIMSGAYADIYIQKGSVFGSAYESCTERRLSYISSGSIINIRQDENGLCYLDTGLEIGEKIPS